MDLARLLIAREHSGAPAVVRPGPEEPEVVTWRDLAAGAERAAARLLDRGLEPCEAVGLRIRQPDRALEAAFGVWLAGGIATHLDPDAAEDDLAARRAHAECRIVLDDADLAGPARDGPSREPDRTALDGPGGLRARPAASEVACYAYVSPPGQGLPLLAAKLTHRGLLAAGEAIAGALRLTEGQRLACGWGIALAARRSLEIACAITGSALVAGTPADFPQTRPHVFVGPYWLIEDLAREVSDLRFWRAASRGGWRRRLAQRLGQHDARAILGGELRLVAATGERLAQGARDLLGSLGVEVAELHSVPEAGGPVALNGVPLGGADVQVADDGHVLVRGDALAAGYLKEPGEWDHRMLGGWFRTGDRGEFRGGRLHLLGPHDAERGLLIRVTAPDVEAALRDQPAIGQALAVPGSPWTALVVPAARWLAETLRRGGIPEDEGLTDPRVEEAIGQAIAAYNGSADFEGRIQQFAIVPGLPHDPLGRLDRASPQAMYEKALESALPAPLLDVAR